MQENEKEEIDSASIEIRYSDLSDGRFLKEWLMDPQVGRWFPIDDLPEVDDAVHRWIGFSRYKCSLTQSKMACPAALPPCICSRIKNSPISANLALLSDKIIEARDWDHSAEKPDSSRQRQVPHRDPPSSSLFGKSRYPFV